MAEPLYRKFGGGVPDPSEGLMKGQQMVNSSFKDALAGVGNLLKTVEQGYIEDNTLKVQEYLKSNIRNAGIGADAPTIEDVKGQFGKLINAEALDKTITGTRDKMLGEARDEASIAAGQAFGETEDIAKAGEAFKQKFLALGGRESQAADEMGKWRLDNAYRAEDVKVANAELISKFKSGVTADIISNKGTDPEEVLNYSLDMLPEKLRTQAKLETRKEVEALSALTGEQQDGHKYIGSMLDTQIQAKEAEILQAQATAKVELDKTIRVPQSAKDAVAKLNGTVGGMGEAIKNDATGQWFARSLFNTGNREEEGAANSVQAGIDGLIEYGIPAEEAMAIGFQAYQDARAENGVGFGGVTIDANTLDRHFTKYAQNYEASKKAESNYVAIQNAAIKERARLVAEKERVLHEFTSGAKHANISGSSFDIQDYIKRFGENESSVPATAVTPATTPTVPVTTQVPAAVVPDLQAVKDKIRFNRGVTTTPTTTPGPIVESVDKPAKHFKDGLIKALTPNAAEASIPPALSPERLAVDRGIVGGIDLVTKNGREARYATAEGHVQKVQKIYQEIPELKTDVDISKYIDSKFPNSPVTGLMVARHAKKFNIDPKVLLAVMQQDSGIGTAGLGAKSRNPGNVGNDDSGKVVTYPTWDAGVEAAARELSKRKVKRTI